MKKFRFTLKGLLEEFHKEQDPFFYIDRFEFICCKTIHVCLCEGKGVGRS